MQHSQNPLHPSRIESTGRLGPDFAQRSQVQQGSGRLLLNRGLADDQSVKGSQRPVDPRNLDAQFLGGGLEGSRSLAGVMDGFDALLSELHGRDEGCHRLESSQ
jgi:hypothetical protein